MFYLDEETVNLVAGAKEPTMKEFRDAHPRCHIKLTHLTISEADRDCYMDLRPYLNPAPHRVPIHSTLSGIYQLFRGLGLRHLLVVDENSRLKGIITRKDLARFKEYRLKSKFHVQEIYISDE